MDNRLTVNCNVAKNRNESLDFARRSNSGSVYFLDPDPQAIHIALDTGKRVRVRIFDPFGDYQGGRYPTFDNEFHNIHTPEDCLNWLLHSEYAQFRGNKNVQFILGMNEPTNNSPEDLQNVIIWVAYYGQLLAENQFGALLGGFNIAKSMRLINTGKGSALAPDVDSGLWDVLLRVAHKYHEWVTIDIHVYSTLRAWFQSVGDPHNKERLFEAHDSDAILWERMPDGNYPPQWYVGRSAPLYIRSNELGYTNAEFGHGEIIWDYMDDRSAMMNALADEFRRGDYPFSSRRLDGIRSLRRLFAYWRDVPDSQYTDVMFGEDAFKDLVFVHEQYPPRMSRYMAVFAGNFNEHWLTYNVFDLEMRPLLNRMINYQPAIHNDNGGFMTFKDALVRSTSASGTNLRDAPNGDVVDKLTDEPLRVQVSEGVEFVGSYNWRIIIIDGKELYAADKFIIISDIPEHPGIPSEDLIRELVAQWFDEKFDDELYLHIGADGSIPRSVIRSMIGIQRAMLSLVEGELDREDNS